VSCPIISVGRAREPRTHDRDGRPFDQRPFDQRPFDQRPFDQRPFDNGAAALWMTALRGPAHDLTG